MGTILTCNSYKNRCVDIPNGSPLLKHIEAKEELEKQKKIEYNMFIKEFQNNKGKENSSHSLYSGSLGAVKKEKVMVFQN